MSEIPKWFERKFDFSFPAELHPNLCVRLAGTPARLEELVRQCSPEQLVRSLGGTWSIQENAGHLLDCETLWLARIEDYLAAVETLTAADLTNRKTHQANHNASQVEAILAEFRAARMNLVSRLERIEPVVFARTALHPRLKIPMRLIDHLHFVAEHDDHHLARIWEIRGVN